MWLRNKPYLMVLPAVCIVSILFFGGLIQGFIQSLGYFPAAGQFDLSLSAYGKLFARSDFWGSLWLTLRIALLSTLASGLLGGLVAVGLYSIAGKWIKGSRLGQRFFQLPLVVPHLVSAYLMVLLLMQSGWASRIMHSLGLITQVSDFPVLINDTFGWGIIFTYAWKEGPFIALMVYPVLTRIQSNWLEVAQIFGANKLQFFKEVVIPLVMPTWLTSLFIVFAFTFSAFEVPYLLGVTYPKMLPVLAFDMYTGEGLQALPEALAVNVILAFITTLLGVLAYWVSKRSSIDDGRGW